MSTASLCSSVQSQISGFGGGLKLQKPSLSQPNSLTFTRYSLLLFGVPFLHGIFIGYVLFTRVLEARIENLCF